MVIIKVSPPPPTLESRAFSNRSLGGLVQSTLLPYIISCTNGGNLSLTKRYFIKAESTLIKLSQKLSNFYTNETSWTQHT